MDVLKAIRTKRAIREFTSETVSADVEEAILDAGRLSQSSKNSQPWQFIVIRDKATLQDLSQLGAYAGHLAGADFAVLLVAESSQNSFDLGQTAAYLQLAAWQLGVGSCIASIYEADKARALLGIPDGYECSTALSFGYPAPRPDEAPKRKVIRKPLSEIIRRDRW